MIQEIKSQGITLEEGKDRAQKILELFKTVVKEFKEKTPNIKLTISETEPFVKIYFIGNKQAGTKYEMECWKEVPIYKCNIDQFSYFEGPNNFFLSMRINFHDGGQSSEDWKLSEEQLRIRFESALINANRDFNETPENIL